MEAALGDKPELLVGGSPGGLPDGKMDAGGRSGPGTDPVRAARMQKSFLLPNSPGAETGKTATCTAPGTSEDTLRAGPGAGPSAAAFLWSLADGVLGKSGECGIRQTGTRSQRRTIPLRGRRVMRAGRGGSSRSRASAARRSCARSLSRHGSQLPENGGTFLLLPFFTREVDGRPSAHEHAASYHGSSDHGSHGVRHDATASAAESVASASGHSSGWSRWQLDLPERLPQPRRLRRRPVHLRAGLLWRRLLARGLPPRLRRAARALRAVITHLSPATIGLSCESSSIPRDHSRLASARAQDHDRFLCVCGAVYL